MRHKHRSHHRNWKRLSFITTDLSHLLVSPRHMGFTPVVKGTPQVLGLVTDPSLNRDSCGSTRFQNRDFWTCRDSQPNNEQGYPSGGIISATGAWTSFDFDGTPYFQTSPLGDRLLLMSGDNKGQPYFPLIPEQCHTCNDCNGNTAGACSDGTRYALWPDSPPMVTAGHLWGPVVAYTWIRNQRLRGLTLLEDNPSVSLRKIFYDPSTPDRNALPMQSVVDGAFWPQGSFPYGVYGNVNHHGVAYLYGMADGFNRPISLARVRADCVEDKSQYEYWVNGCWTPTQPAIDDPGAHIHNAGTGGQGTFFFFEPWQRYVWIGQPGISIHADFMITTAPEPQGPWEEPRLFYQGENGNAALPAYSLQVHPHMTTLGRREMYLTYTKCDRVEGVDWDIYSTPMIRVEWE